MRKGRVWLRLSRAGETVHSWGEKPEEGLGISPHETVEVNVIVPLPETRANDIIQVVALARELTHARIESESTRIFWWLKRFCGHACVRVKAGH